MTSLPCKRGNKLHNAGYQIKKIFWCCAKTSKRGLVLALLGFFISAHLARMRNRDDHTVNTKYICIKQPLAKNRYAKLSVVHNDYQPGLLYSHGSKCQPKPPTKTNLA